MLWAALLPDDLPSDPPRRAEALDGLAAWCLQFTPRVAVLEALATAPAVVMELEASARLFGGKRRLVECVHAQCAELGVRQLSWAPTSLAAVALARAGCSNGFAAPLERLLDALPVETLGAAAVHQDTLARLGCRTLGQLRALPRGGVARRFDAALLVALDQAYGLRPQLHDWVRPREVFEARLELMARVAHAPTLLFGARRLMLQMCGWLAARHAGVTAFALHWRHDALRPAGAGDGGEYTVRTAQPSRDVEHLMRLLAEHLARLRLDAPVGELALCATEVRALPLQSLALWPDRQHSGERLERVLERIAARLGADRVLRPVLLEDHRPEWMCRWQPAQAAPPAPKRRLGSSSGAFPQPSWLLVPPLRLAVRADRPLYQGVLRLLAGPHRIEGGWWDRTTQDGVESTHHVARDYWVAASAHAGVLWIFRARLADGQETGWFLHGVFA